jgi:hypothetical protein
MDRVAPQMRPTHGNAERKGAYVDDDERQVWELAVELGPPDATGPGSSHGEGIHPIALALEEGAHRIRRVNGIPCFPSFGPVLAIAEFAERAWGDARAPGNVPVECRLAVYLTDDGLDELVTAVVEDLGLSEDGYSTTIGREVVIRLQLSSLKDPANSFYRSLAEQYKQRDSTT